MSTTLLQHLKGYVRNVMRGIWSIASSSVTAFPYVFRVDDLRKRVTEDYPDPVSSKTADDLPSRSRGLLYNDIERCTGCAECERICPTDCIQVKIEKEVTPGKNWVTVFDIDYSRCIFCGLCVEVCVPGSLVHTREFEGATHQITDLVASFGRGEVSPEQRRKWKAIREMNEQSEEDRFDD